MLKQAVVDLDGVLVNFHDGLLKVHQIDCPYLSDRSHLGEWDIYGAIQKQKLKAGNKEIPKEKFWAPCLTKEFWVELQPTPEYQQVLKIVEDAVGFTHIALLTSPFWSAECIYGKMLWVEKYLPHYKGKLLIGSAKEFCAARDRVLIDDADKNINAFSRNGGLGILYPQLWNSKHYKVNERLEILKEGLEYYAKIN